MSLLDCGYIDYAYPMNYTEDMAKYAELLAVQLKKRNVATRIVGGIGEAGHGGWNSRSVLNFGVLVNGLVGFLCPSGDGRVGFGGDEDAQVWFR